MMIQADANNTANELRNHFKHSTDCDHLTLITRGSAASAWIVEYSGEQTVETFMSFCFSAVSFHALIFLKCLVRRFTHCSA